MADKQSRKYTLVINNSNTNGWTHEKIIKTAHSLKSISYFCLADEKGATYHTHLYLQFSSAVRFSTLKKKFPTAHIESAKGTALDNRAYIRKEGKWTDSEKHETVIEGTFYEEGECPVEQQGHRTDLDFMLQLIKAGASNMDLIEANSKMMFYVDKIEKVRQEIKAAESKSKFRKLDVTYIFGDPGVGKTRSVMDKYGYDAVARITDYEHPFETYNSATNDVILFDEFRSQLPITDMLCYLDGYPVQLPCRYANKWACYSTVYIISNVPLNHQYPDIQSRYPLTWAALMRRINRVVEMRFGQEPKVTIPIESVGGFTPLDDDEDIPFD